MKALRAQTIEDELDIIVIDNHSDDESIGYIRSQTKNMPRVRIVETPKNIGYGCGNNEGLRLVHSPWTLIINPDNRLPPDGLEHMIEVMSRDTSIGIAGPKLVYNDGTIRPSARSFPTLRDLLWKRLWPDHWHRAYNQSMEPLLRETIVETDWIVGACLFMRTDDLRRLGGFDPRFFLFFEDIDLCRRMKNELGKRAVYLPNIAVQDRRGRLSGSHAWSLLTRKTTRIHLWSAIKYGWKWRRMYKQSASFCSHKP